MTTIEDLNTDLQTHLKTARDLADAAESAGRDFTAEERSAVEQALLAARDAKTKLEAETKRRQQADSDAALRAAIGELGDGIVFEPDAKTGLVTPAEPGRRGRGDSIGKSFVSSQAYKDLLAAAPGGYFGEKSRVQSAPVSYKSLITGADRESAGVYVQNDWRGLLFGLDQYELVLRMRGVVTAASTTSDTIEYARVTGVDNGAAMVPEATGTADGSGVKPESGMRWDRVTTTVKTLAHWMPITKRALSDAAQVRSLIDAFLHYGLEELLEEQMLLGDGTGENLTGLMHTSGIQRQPLLEDSDVGLLRTLRRAKTLVRQVGRGIPSAFLVNPMDAERIDLTIDANQRFYFGGPYQSDAIRPLWGLPVIECETLPEGTAYVADWRRAILWDREQANITVSDSHADFFVRNMVAILAEARVAFGITHPKTFVEIDLDGGAS
jgi:HK97 family phage major capsid protein